MTLRNRFLITAACFVTCFSSPPLVTSQLPPAPRRNALDAAEKSAPCSNTLRPGGRGAEGKGDVHTICAIQQEEEGAVYKLHGAVEIYYGSYILRADEATYNSDTKEATATGHFALDGGPNDDHIRASHGTYNLELETGTFLRCHRNHRPALSRQPGDPDLDRALRLYRQGGRENQLPNTTWSTTARSLPASCRIPSGSSTRARLMWRWAATPKSIAATF